jgi:hypothetical protein
MEGSRSNWTDDRLDDLAERIGRFEVRMDTRLSQIDSTLHGMQRTIVGTHRTMIALFVVIAGIVGAGHL